MQLKLDELIRVSIPARDDFFDLEDLTDAELDELDDEFKRLRDNNSPPSLHKLHTKIIATRHKRLK